jgi:hypothetical protein
MVSSVGRLARSRTLRIGVRTGSGDIPAQVRVRVREALRGKMESLVGLLVVTIAFAAVAADMCVRGLRARKG